MERCTENKLSAGSPYKPLKLGETASTDDKLLSAWRTTKEYLDWKLRDEAGQGLLRGAMGPTQWPHVVLCKSAKEIGHTVEKIISGAERIENELSFDQFIGTLRQQRG